ncbi:MAG: winged helix-turn-helix domain-containing protein [Reichenbachiella sp.]|uniref:winged helix-turn-helix domain-containing protein n=1 Tax=Reichenbachiella sp. TaxID=2184521 RepID=UPI0032653858
MISSSDLKLRPFRIGDWLILPEINRIIHSSGKHNIGSRTMKVLVCLAQNQGQVVTKETLMETVWKDVVVTEDSLMKSISVLRKIFELPGEDGPKIDTIRSVGYILLSPIEYTQTHRLVEELKRRKPKKIALLIVLAGLVIFGFYIIKSSGTIDTGGLVNVTDDWGQERVPRFSPDGRQVMFAAGAGGNNNMDIYIKNLISEEVNQIDNPHNIETDPVWSPSGEKIAYFRNDGKQVWIILKSMVDSTEKKLITVHAIVNLSAMVWTPDGASIIYSDRLVGQRVFALHQVDIKTKKITQLTTPEARMIGDSSPRISPDGKTLAYIRSHRYNALYYHLIPGYGRLMIKTMDSDSSINLTKEPEQITGVCWADSDHLIYSYVHKNYAFRMASLHIKSGQKTTLHESSDIIRNLDYHLPTNRLIFETWNESYNLWKFSDLPQSTNFSSRLMNNHTSWNPSYHEKTNQLAYVSKETGFAEIWIRDLTSESSIQVTDFNGPIIRHPQWSPDGKQLVFEINNDRNDDVYLLDIKSKTADRIVEDRAEETYPIWSQDGLAIYYGSNESGEFQIRKMTLKDSLDVQLTTNGGIRAIPYQDVLYYSLPYSMGIWKLEGEKEEQVVESFIPNDIGNWEIVNDRIFYISRSRYAKPELYYLDIENGTQHHYQSFSYQVSYTFDGLTYDTASNSWLVTLMDRVRSDIKMITIDPTIFNPAIKSRASGYAFYQ